MYVYCVYPIFYWSDIVKKNGSKVGFWKKDINADAHIGGEGVSIEGGSYDTENSQVYSLKEKGSM